jgi:hypothetical protein
MRLTFIVSTGRCGSTLLSEILHRHPDILSMSEFFISMRPGTDEVINGRRFWDILSSPEPSVDSMVRDGLAPNLRYPYGTGRFNVETGVPRICHITLPALSDDPDALFTDLAGEVPTWPTRASWEQIRVLFEYLAKVFDRRVIVVARAFQRCQVRVPFSGRTKLRPVAERALWCAPDGSDGRGRDSRVREGRGGVP